jgi:hypothetical protein
MVILSLSPDFIKDCLCALQAEHNFILFGIPAFILLAVFNLKLIPEGLKRCPHGVMGGITKERCPKCNELKTRKELREKWRDEDSHKLWEIFDEEKEKKITDDRDKQLKVELEYRNQMLWEEEKRKLEEDDNNIQKQIKEKNQELWDLEVRGIDKRPFPNSPSFSDKKSEKKQPEDIFLDELDEEYGRERQKRDNIWKGIEKNIVEIEKEELTEEELIKKQEIRKKMERVFQEEHEKINYLKRKKMSHLKGLTLKTFETYILEMFKKLGYVTRSSRRESDAGKIIVLYRHNAKHLLLCKKYPESCQINISEVQKLAMAIANQRAAGGFLITTCNFSKPAYQAAKDSKIEAVDVYQLTKMLNEAYPVSFPDERIRCVCSECGEIVYFNLFDSRESLPCRFGHDVANMVENRRLQS